jgi:hypothetical protein
MNRILTRLFFFALLSTSTSPKITASTGTADALSLTPFLSLPFKGIVTKILVPYGIYSFAVDKYAKQKVESMKDLPTIGDQEEMSVFTPEKLRKTISKRNNLVLDPNDRYEWNRFIISNSASTSTSPHPPIASSTFLNDLVSLCGKYEFAYRSYVNFEEVGAICKPFYNWRQLLLVFTAKGLMTIKREEGKDGKELIEDKDKGEEEEKEEKEEKNGMSTIRTSTHVKNKTLTAVKNLHVTNVERFRFGIFLPLEIKWHGKIVEFENENENENENEKCLKIVWTKTEMIVANRFNFDNPKVSTELSSTPWDIIKLNDGMICFKRGDIGYLVYDSG